MYRTATPPLFDIPDFPTFRRVKPLPKRRRTSLNPNNSGISPTLLSRSNSHLTYTTSAYSTHPSQPPSQHIPRLPTDVLSSVVDAQRSQYDWRLPPDFFLPEEILRAACALPETGSTPRIDDEGGGDDSGGGGGTEEPFLPQARKSPKLISPGTLPLMATPPPPSDASTDDEQPQDTSFQPTHFRSSKQHLDHKELNVEEELVSGSEGDLTDPLPLPAETDRLLAHADSLSAKMALRSYYHSMGYSLPEFGSSVGASPSPVPSPGMGQFTSDYSVPPVTGTLPMNRGVAVANAANFGNIPVGSGYIGVGVGRGQDEGDNDSRGGDYTDHSNQQGQGNTKKRKVPANVGNSPPHHHHHHFGHYTSHRTAMPTSGTSGLAYGHTGVVEGDEKEFSFGLGFGLDLGLEASTENSGLESDVFDPLVGPNRNYQHQSQLVQIDSDQRYPPRQFHRKAKLSPVTLAGLQRKELIRTRKKQLEMIMGSLGDSWALDHALSANFPPLLSSSTSSSSSASNSPTTDSDQGYARAEPRFRRPDGESDENLDISWGWNDGEGREMRVRLSRRKKMRIARSTRMGLGRLGRHPDAAPFPTGDFVVSCPSSTAERLVTMQEEVANLRNLFGTEIARQTAKSATVASSTGKGNGTSSGKVKKKRAQQRARTIMSAESGEQQAEFLEMPQKGTDSSIQMQTSPSQVSSNQNQGPTSTPKKGKKKKRSTMANASNPHHLRNYVPSRLPHAAGGGGSTGGNHGQGNQAASFSTIWPLALKFLSADLPPRRRKGVSGERRNGINVQSLPQLVVPQEEWICLFCEYNLFYGEEAEYRRAVRNRKKILKRRRRARERAAAAASGVNAGMKNAAPVGDKTRVEEEEEEEYDGADCEAVLPNSTGTINARMDTTGSRTRAPDAPG